MIRHHYIDTSEYTSVKFSSNSDNTLYFNGGSTNVYVGTPDVLYNDFAVIKHIGTYTHGAINSNPNIELDEVPTTNSNNLINSGNIKKAIEPARLGFGYASCTTVAATAAKVASLSNYNLVNGGLVVVYFQNDVPAQATLNINNQGAKEIHFGSSRIAANVIKAGDKCLFIYNGNYMLIAIDRWGKELQEKVSGINISETDFEALSTYEQGKLYFVYDNNS